MRTRTRVHMQWRQLAACLKASSSGERRSHRGSSQTRIPILVLVVYVAKDSKEERTWGALGQPQRITSNHARIPASRTNQEVLAGMQKEVSRRSAEH